MNDPEMHGEEEAGREKAQSAHAECLCAFCASSLLFPAGPAIPGDLGMEPVFYETNPNGKIATCLTAIGYEYFNK